MKLSLKYKFVSALTSMVVVNDGRDNVLKLREDEADYQNNLVWCVII